MQLAREVVPGIPVIRADGPVPLRDRAAHVAQLEQAAGGSWIIVPYTYDVEGVLAGDVSYPRTLKIATLEARQQALGIDGLAFGIRASESRGRTWSLRTRGHTYARRGVLACTPLATWSADEVVGYLIATNRLPLNPVYERDYLQPDLNLLRDGTWMPNQTADAHGYRHWLSWHYTEHVEHYDRAIIALRGGR